MRYRKRPLVIHAEQYTGDLTRLSPEFRHAICTDGGLHIDTLEGPSRVRDGDWIVKGTLGEWYPIKPAVFAQVYEPCEAAP